MTRPAEQASRDAGCGARQRKPCPVSVGRVVRITRGQTRGRPHPATTCSRSVEPPAFLQKACLPAFPGPGGERCRRQDRPGRCPVPRGCPARWPRGHGPCRAGRDLSAHTINRGGRILGDSAGSLTISSNSLSSQSSSSQTNAQNCSSTAPEPTGVQVFPPPRIASHPLAPRAKTSS